MIEIEERLFPRLAQTVRESFPSVKISSTYINEPGSFPFVSFEEADNYTDSGSQDSSGKEKFSILMYEVNVYSNKADGKKAECNAILGLIDKWLFKQNFKRLSKTPVPNMQNATLYRVVARYGAKVSDTGVLYRL